MYFYRLNLLKTSTYSIEHSHQKYVNVYCCKYTCILNITNNQSEQLDYLLTKRLKELWICFTHYLIYSCPLMIIFKEQYIQCAILNCNILLSYDIKNWKMCFPTKRFHRNIWKNPNKEWKNALKMSKILQYLFTSKTLNFLSILFFYYHNSWNS